MDRRGRVCGPAQDDRHVADALHQFGFGAVADLIYHRRASLAGTHRQLDLDQFVVAQCALDFGEYASVSPLPAMVTTGFSLCRGAQLLDVLIRVLAHIQSGYNAPLALFRQVPRGRAFYTLDPIRKPRPMARKILQQGLVEGTPEDPYVQQAQREGYRSRACYKLLEIQERDRLSGPV